MEYQRFVKRFLAVNILILFTLAVVTYNLLNILNENYSNDEIIHNSQNILYGSAITNGATIKLDIIQIEKPRVVALGSSRVMQFRAFFFKKSFYTMGGLGDSIDEVAHVWNIINKNYTPEVVIIGIDPWWLNPNFYQSNRWINKQQSTDYSKYFELYKNTKVLKQLFHIDEIKEVDPISGLKNIGLDAAINGNGYRLSDGSRQYGKIIHDKEDNTARFKSTYELMKKGSNRDRFVWCDNISDTQLNNLNNLLTKIKNSGAKVIVFLPPFPHEVYNYMDNNIHFRDYLHSYMNETKKICSELDIPWYNFTDLATTGGTDDEAVDGYHGSELAYARITYLIGKDKRLANYVDNEKLEYAINHPIDNFQAIPASK